MNLSQWAWWRPRSSLWPEQPPWEWATCSWDNRPNKPSHADWRHWAPVQEEASPCGQCCSGRDGRRQSRQTSVAEAGKVQPSRRRSSSALRQPQTVCIEPHTGRLPTSEHVCGAASHHTACESQANADTHTHTYSPEQVGVQELDSVHSIYRYSSPPLDVYCRREPGLIPVNCQVACRWTRTVNRRWLLHVVYVVSIGDPRFVWHRDVVGEGRGIPHTGRRTLGDKWASTRLPAQLIGRHTALRYNRYRR